MSNKIITLVLGMHRSGTSVLARAVNALGADYGNNLMPPASDNPKGFFEDLGVVDINDRLLDSLDLQWDIPCILKKKEIMEKGFGRIYEEAHVLMREFLQANDFFVIKDPRLALVLPFWLTLFDDLGVSVRFAISYRDGAAVAGSLRRRNGFYFKDSLYLWVSYYYQILRFLRDRPEPKVVVAYEHMLEDPVRELDRLKDKINVKSEVYGNQSNSLASAKNKDLFAFDFIDPDLDHSDEGLEDERKHTKLVPEVGIIANVLEKIAESGWDSDFIADALGSLSPDYLNSENFKAYLRRSERFGKRLINTRRQEAAQLIRDGFSNRGFDLPKGENFDPAAEIDKVCCRLQELHLEKDSLLSSYESLGREQEEDRKILAELENQKNGLLKELEHVALSSEAHERDLVGELERERLHIRHLQARLNEAEEAAYAHASSVQRVEDKYKNTSTKLEDLRSAFDKRLTGINVRVGALFIQLKNLEDELKKDILMLNQTKAILEAHRSSVSYKVGRAVTLPFRVVYNIFV